MTAQRLLITGASGQVGTALRTHPGAGAFELLTPTSTQLNLADPPGIDAWMSVHEPTIVVNAAAYTAVDKAEDEPQRAHAINARGAGTLAAAAARCGARFVQLSTDYVFDGTGRSPYRESDTPNPTSVYGASKLNGERAVAAACAQALILRVSWVFSATGNNFVKTMLRLATSHSPLRVVDDQHGTPCSARSIADVIFALLRHRDHPDGVLHFGSTPATTWHGFACAIFDEAMNLGLTEHRPAIVPITTAQFNARAPRPANSLFDCTRLTRMGLSIPSWQTELTHVLSELRESRS